MTGVPSTGRAPKRTRAEWHALFIADRARVLTGTQIANRHGVGHTFVYSVLNDPTGDQDRKRKDKYRGKCTRCGSKTDGSNGAAKAPTICKTCIAELMHENRHWTPDRIILAIQAFAAKHGRPPVAREWQVVDRDGGPTVSLVQREFGTWVAAIRAAGFDCAEVGRYERNEETRRRMRVANSLAGIDWTPELILKAMRRWKRKHGSPPTTVDWHYAAHDHPMSHTVANRFGSWNAAIVAAGFTPNKRGRKQVSA